VVTSRNLIVRKFDLFFFLAQQILHMEMMEFIDKHGVELTTERISTIIERKIDVLDRQVRICDSCICLILSKQRINNVHENC